MEDEQHLVASILKSAPAPDVRGDFIARVNARIDAAAEAGWLGLADFRVWTLRLAPAAAALALLAALWASPGSASVTATAAPTAEAASTFSPASSTDWQRDVTADALLDAALSPRGGSDGR
jgi:hypothetical protein